MNRSKFIFLILLATVANFASSLFALEKYTIQKFISYPTARDLQISPDGRYLSIVFKKSDRDYLGILDRKTRKVLRTFGVRGRRKSVGHVYWVNNQRLVYSVVQNYVWDKEQFENGELLGVNVDGSQHKLIFGYNAGTTQIASRKRVKKAEYGNQQIIDLLDNDPNNILITFYPWKLKGRVWRNNENAKPVVYKLNVYSGDKQSIDYLPTPNADAYL